MIELLIVIGLLGALATLMLPRLTATRTDAMDPIVHKEMQDIRRAFQRFYSDVMPNDAQLEIVRTYGLAPLIAQAHAGAYSSADFPSWDEAKQRGWRGPYLDAEGTRTIAGVAKVPVILDPYAGSAGDGHYYRVLCRKNDGTNWSYQDLALVFVGVEDDVTVGADTTDLLDTAAVNTPQTVWADKYVAGADQELVKKLVIDRE